MNAQVERRRDSNPDGYIDVLGPYGLEVRNGKGRDLLQVYLTNKLSIMNTFYDLRPTSRSSLTTKRRRNACST